jgi:hypothetical protein
VVDAFSNQFGNFINELNTITDRGKFAVQPKLKPVQPKTVNLNIPNLPATSNNYSPSGGVGTGSPLSGGTDLEKLMKAIRSQESNNNYSAYNGMYGASGAYQILKSNFADTGGWDKEALGRDISYDEFMKNPGIQDAIARYKLGKYLQQYGAAGAAVAWYGGPGQVKNMYSKTTQRGGYPSLYAYWQSVLNKM